MSKPVLDPCCGPKQFYFDKEDTRVDFRDNRNVDLTLCDGRVIHVRPDTTGDVTSIDAPDGVYHLVVFDPPHLDRGSGWQVAKYGKLPSDWKPWMEAAFAECWRVLSPNGTLVFKWNEYAISLSEVLACAPAKPVLGNRKPKQSKTHWLIFFKED